MITEARRIKKRISGKGGIQYHLRFIVEGMFDAKPQNYYKEHPMQPCTTQPLKKLICLFAFLTLFFTGCGGPIALPTTTPTHFDPPLPRNKTAIRMQTAALIEKATPEPPSLLPTQIITIAPTFPATATANLAEVQIPGDVYILLRPVKPPFLLALGRLPVACLLESQGCSPIEILYQDRNPEQPVLRQTDLVFSPDGKSIWWNNDYHQNIYALNTESKAIQPIAQNILAVRGDFQWSPDGRWVALAAQGNGPYDGQVMLLDSQSGGRQILLNTPNELKFPVGWKNNHVLFTLILQYGPPADNPNGKWVENRAWLALLDITSGQAREYLTEESFGISSSSLSPNRQWLSYYQTIHGNPNLYLRSVTEEKLLDLKTDWDLIGWSPDSQWIALRSPNGDISVLHPDGTGERKVTSIQSEIFTVRWFVDNLHLLVIENVTNMDGLDRVNISLISIDDGTAIPIEIKGLNAMDYLPYSLSFTP